MNRRMRKSIIQISILYVVMFVLTISYLSYFVIVKSKDIVIHTNNRRMDPLENEVIRGDILSSDGQVIATTVTKGEQSVRTYPKSNRYAHVIGYTQKGKTGMEAFANVELLRANYTLESIFKKAFHSEKFIGRDVVVTIDDKLQEAAQNALGNQKGAIVLIEPSTGKIKALISKPDFDPNRVSQNWEELITDEKSSPLLNRAVFGLYPPGSIFKVVTTLAFLDAEGIDADMQYTCDGQITIDNHTIRCFNQIAHGNENLSEAFTQSCNTYFIAMGEKIGANQLQKQGEKLLFNTPLPITMEHSKSQLVVNEQTPGSELAATSIGQGKTLVTPLHMAMLAAAISNEGVLMKPYIFDYSQDKKGNIKAKNLPEYVGQIIDAKQASKLREMMVQVVQNGTGQKAAVRGMYIGGKTGTAQNETKQDHSWFIGFVGKEDQPDIAMAIIIENGGKGAQATVIANKIAQAYKNYY